MKTEKSTKKAKKERKKNSSKFVSKEIHVPVPIETQTISLYDYLNERPTANGNYLVFLKDGIWQIRQYFDGKFYNASLGIDISDIVRFWAYLPEPPKTNPYLD